MPKFRKKPVVIEAAQFDGYNVYQLKMMYPKQVGMIVDGYLEIHTLEGTMRASPGDWIIKGVHGEVYPCKPEIFKATYEAVDEDNECQEK